MLASKYDDAGFDGGNLGERLEALLASYVKSTGSEGGGVPAELIQGATQIASQAAPLQQAGPADAVAESDDEEKKDTALPDDAAALLDGGMDDVGPLRI